MNLVVNEFRVKNGLIVGGDIVPDGDSTRDLGTSSLYFAEAYIDKITTTGVIELGHASQTTLSGSGGTLSVEGTAVVLAGSASHDGFSDFVANEHIDHTSVTLTAGDGLSGGGTIAADRTFAVEAAQTTITSILATDLIIGEDSQTAIDFGTADEIDFKAANAVQLTLSDGVFRPQTDSDVDLGTSAIFFKDAFIDKITTTGNIELGHASDTTIARASSGVISVEGNNVIMASNDVSALTDSTSAAIGIGTIELGHASDTTIARASAGQITVEGTAVVLAGSASHDGFSDFVANEHIDHTSVTLTAGDGLSGGGTIAADRTFAVEAAQTTITSILATDLIIGEDSQTAIDFGTADEIDFKAANAVQLTLSDGVFRPQTDSDVDLGTSAIFFKDAFIDKITTTGNIELGHASDTTIARASSGVISVEGNNVIMASNDVSALTDSTSAAIGIGTIELGHASDTTIARASAGVISVEGETVITTGNLKSTLAAGFASNAVTIGDSNDVVTIGNDLTVEGDLTVNGDTVTVDTATLVVEDPLIKLAKGNAADTVDVGIYAQYTESSTTKYAGIIRDASVTGDPWTFFDSLTTEPTTTATVGSNNFDFADVKAGGITAVDGFTGNVTGNADTATSAGTVGVTPNNAAGSFVNENNLIMFLPDGDSSTGAGNYRPESSTDFYYNPSTTVLTVPKVTSAFTGNLTGNASGSAGTVTSIGNLTGDVTSSNRATTIADNAVTLAKMAGLARGKIIYGDSNGDPAALTIGSNGQVLTSDGTDISWGSVSSGVTVGTHAGTNNLAYFSDTGEISNSNNASFTAATGAVDFFGSVEAGNVKIGTNTNKNTVETSSAQDLILRTNGGTNSGTLTITDGANGNITLAPNGTGIVDISTALEVGTGTNPLNNGVVTIINDDVDTYPKTLLLMDNESDNTNGPVLTLYRNTASPADGDILGKIELNGEDDAGNPRAYGSIRQESTTVADGSHAGTLFLNVAISGAQTDVIAVDGTGGYGGLTHTPSGIKTLGNVVGATSTANNGYITLLAVPHANFKAVKASIHITDSSSNEVQTQETIAHYDGSNANYSNYGIIYDGAAAIGAIEVDINSSNIRFRFKNTQGATRNIAGSIHAVCHP